MIIILLGNTDVAWFYPDPKCSHWLMVTKRNMGHDPKLQCYNLNLCWWISFHHGMEGGLSPTPTSAALSLLHLVLHGSKAGVAGSWGPPSGFSSPLCPRCSESASTRGSSNSALHVALLPPQNGPWLRSVAAVRAASHWVSAGWGNTPSAAAPEWPADPLGTSRGFGSSSWPVSSPRFASNPPTSQKDCWWTLRVLSWCPAGFGPPWALTCCIPSWVCFNPIDTVDIHRSYFPHFPSIDSPYFVDFGKIHQIFDSANGLGDVLLDFAHHTFLFHQGPHLRLQGAHALWQLLHLVVTAALGECHDWSARGICDVGIEPAICGWLQICEILSKLKWATVCHMGDSWNGVPPKNLPKLVSQSAMTSLNDFWVPGNYLISAQ